MKLEEQVCSLELAQKLRSLDVEQYSLWTWCDINGKWSVEWSQSDESIKATQFAAAFTGSELGRMLPDGIDTRCRNKAWYCILDTQVTKVTKAQTEADARALMVGYLVENNFHVVERRKPF